MLSRCVIVRRQNVGETNGWLDGRIISVEGDVCEKALDGGIGDCATFDRLRHGK